MKPLQFESSMRHSIAIDVSMNPAQTSAASILSIVLHACTNVYKSENSNSAKWIREKWIRFCFREIKMNWPFVSSFFGHIAAELIVEMLSGVSTGRNTAVVALWSRQRLLHGFNRLVFCAIFRHRIGTFIVIWIAAVHAPAKWKEKIISQFPSRWEFDRLPHACPHGSPQNAITVIAMRWRCVGMLFESMRMREAFLLMMSSQSATHQDVQRGSLVQ